MEIIEEDYLDEIFDLNPFLGEIMSSNHPSSSSSSSPRLISFDNSNAHHMLDYNSNHERESSQIINFSSSHDSSKNPNPNPNPCNDVVNGVTRKWVSTTTRTRSQAQDHLMAERKRRQNLSQLFITLSKVVPGLTKLDKTSILEDAINYLKALQERVSDLERSEEMKIKRDHVDNNSCYNNIGSTSKSRVPEISVRIAERHVLMKIYCKKQLMDMIMQRIPSEIEKMNLNVIDIRMMPFGGEALDVTILAEMRNKFGGTVKDIVNHLEFVIKQEDSHS